MVLEDTEWEDLMGGVNLGSPPFDLDPDLAAEAVAVMTSPGGVSIAASTASGMRGGLVGCWHFVNTDDLAETCRGPVLGGRFCSRTLDDCPYNGHKANKDLNPSILNGWNHAT